MDSTTSFLKPYDNEQLYEMNMLSFGAEVQREANCEVNEKTFDIWGF